MTWSVEQGDAREVLRSLESASVDCIVSSPPYNVGIEYAEVSDTLPWSEYFDMAENVAEQLYRVIKPSGRMWWNTPPVVADLSGGRVMLQDEWACIFRNAGFAQRDTVAWVSARGAGTAWGSWQSPSAPNLRGDWEAIGVFHKGQWPRERPADAVRDSEGEWQGLCTNVWKVTPEGDRTHPAPFPVEIPRRCIRLSTWRDELVLDPFAGSSTVGVACMELGRNYVGIELSREYVAMSGKRLRATQPGLVGL